MNTLKAEKRSLDVKAKKLRKEGYVTGNVYGREMKNSIPVKMLRTDVDRLLKTDNKGSQIILDVDGTPYDVLIKEVSFNPVAGRMEEIGFQALVSNEKVHATAEIIPLNHEKIATGVFQLNLSEISYRAYPSALVDRVKVDVSRMKVGDVLKVKDLDIASNPEIELKTDREAIVATVTAVHNVLPDDTAEETAE